VIDDHEHSIVRTILDQQYTWARRQYPGFLSPSKDVQCGWNDLEKLFRRIAVLSSTKSMCLVIRQGHGEHSAWTTYRSMTFHHAGLLLLYRLSDLGVSILPIIFFTSCLD